MKVFSVPASVKVPDFADAKVDGRFSYEKYRELSAAFVADLAAKLRADGWTGDLTGETVSFPIADGAAEYMVAVKPGAPMILIHLPLGDAWQIPAAHARGLRQKDIRELVAQRRRIAKLFADKKGS